MRTDEGVQVDEDIPELRLHLWTSGRVPPPPSSPNHSLKPLIWGQLSSDRRSDAAVAVETAPRGDRN